MISISLLKNLQIQRGIISGDTKMERSKNDENQQNWQRRMKLQGRWNDGKYLFVRDRYPNRFSIFCIPLASYSYLLYTLQIPISVAKDRSQSMLVAYRTIKNFPASDLINRKILFRKYLKIKKREREGKKTTRIFDKIQKNYVIRKFLHIYQTVNNFYADFFNKWKG